MARKLTFDNDAKIKILSGVTKLKNVVAKTMGPRGKNVIIQKYVGNPVVTKDGVSVAREVVLPDSVENMACQLLKEAAGRTAEVAGDGTTTATVLGHAIFSKAYYFMHANQSARNIDIINGIELAKNKIIEKLNEYAIPADNTELIRNIATISANNDQEMGALIAEAFEKVNLTGIVTAEAIPGNKSFIKEINGYEYKKGYIHQAFSLDGADVTMENPLILISSDEITSIGPWVELLGAVIKTGRPLLLIAKGLKQEALAVLLENNKLGKLRVVATEFPPEMRGKDDWQKDFAAMCGTTILSSYDILNTSTTSTFKFGEARKIVVGKYLTKILEPAVNTAYVNDVMAVYQRDLDNIIGEAERAEITKRVSMFSQKSAVVVVGYSTEAELREKGDRLEDAICATKAAIEEGFVPGGGSALFKISKELESENIPTNLLNGFNIMLDAVKSPMREILYNAGIEESVIFSGYDVEKLWSRGYNVRTEEWCDLIDSGVIDPKKVTRAALMNATSIALLLINSDAIVSDIENDETGWQPPVGWRPPDNKNLNHKS